MKLFFNIFDRKYSCTRLQCVCPQNNNKFDLDEIFTLPVINQCMVHSQIIYLDKYKSLAASTLVPSNSNKATTT